MGDYLKDLPEWNDPGVEPPQQLKDEGWRIAQRPPASYFDWLQYTVYQALKELQENATHTKWIGVLSTLTTTAKDTIVAAINELKGRVDTNATDIGTKTSLTTTAKTNLVAAVNELDAEHGALTGLTTTAKNTLVAAINEVNGEADTNATNIGALSGLQTTTKTSLVAAINENKGKIDTNTTNIGTLADLTTTAKTDLVAAINEVKGLTDGNKTSIGTLADLTTTAKTDLVAAINEVKGLTDGFAKGKSTTSGNGSATSVLITHGLGTVPTFYQVVSASADAGTAEISHITAAPGGLTVTFKNALASGTNNIVLVWKAEK